MRLSSTKKVGFVLGGGKMIHSSTRRAQFVLGARRLCSKQCYAGSRDESLQDRFSGDPVLAACWRQDQFRVFLVLARCP